MHRAGVSVVAGTDSFDSYLPLGLSLHAELANLVAAGMTPKQALLAATRESARLLGMTRTRGTVSVGKLADLVLLDGRPHRRHQRDAADPRRDPGRARARSRALDRMLADVRAAAER